jgi:hypothetical protein
MLHVIGELEDEPSPPEGEDVRFATLVRLASLLKGAALLIVTA